MTLVDTTEAAAGAAVVEPGDLAEGGGAGRPLRVDVWRRFRRNKLAMIGLAWIAFLILLAIFAPMLAPYSITDRPWDGRQGMSLDHPFGADNIGRDQFSRVLHGARVSVRIGISASAISLTVGTLIGSIAGYLGGKLDSIMMRITDIFFAIPYVILAVALATVLGGTENSVILILGFTNWPTISRIVRASFLSIKNLEYVEAARALGYSHRRVMLRHMMPNAVQPIIIYGTISVGAVVLSEAALSFLGVGPQEPTPAWGLMVAEAKGFLTNEPILLLAPGLSIVSMVLAFVFMGDGLRDALDPKLRR